VSEPRDSADDREVRTLEDRARVEREVRAAFGERIAPVERLRDFAVDHFIPWRGRAMEPGGIDSLVAAEGMRATKTFHGALHLVLGGFGPQGAMLNRSLFEGMAVAHWVTVGGKDAVDRFEKHARHNQLLWAGALETVGWTDPSELPSAEQDERRELDDLFGAYGQRHWSGLSMHRLVQGIEHLWPEGEPRRTLWEYLRIAHRDNNQTLHSTADALSGGVRIGDDHLKYDGFPSGRFVQRALVGSYWCYMQMVTLMFDRFHIPDRSELDRMWVEDWPTMM
jgi:hypothetical protein